MTEVAEDKETITFSNVSIVRDQDGKMAVFVGQEKMLGVVGINMQPTNDGGLWTFGIPSAKVRLCERVPAQPVYADNVVPFPLSGVAHSVTPLDPSGDGSYRGPDGA